MQSVQAPSLRVDRGLRRVQVLGHLVGVHRPAAEGDHRSGVTADRDHQPVPEPIDHLARVALHGQPALNHERRREPLFQQPRLQRVARHRRVAEPQLLGRRRRDAALEQLLTGAAARGAVELLAEVCSRDLVHLQQRLAHAGVAAHLVAVLARLGQRDAELLCEHPHGILKPDLLVQLEELEHIAADAAAEAVKEPLLRVDLKRGRLLGVERTEALVARARLPHRDVLLHDLQDVGLQAEVVDECLRKQTHVSP